MSDSSETVSHSQSTELGDVQEDEWIYYGLLIVSVYPDKTEKTETEKTPHNNNEGVVQSAALKRFEDQGSADMKGWKTLLVSIGAM